MTEDVFAEISAWFRDRGFDLAVAVENGVWWAKLTPVGNPAGAMTRYGRGDTPEAAAQRARERYGQEQ
jgi:hypothetical protein